MQITELQTLVKTLRRPNPETNQGDQDESATRHVAETAAHPGSNKDDRPVDWLESIVNELSKFSTAQGQPVAVRTGSATASFQKSRARIVLADILNTTNDAQTLAGLIPVSWMAV